MPIDLLEPTRTSAAASRPGSVLRGPVTLVVATVALGLALQVNFGQYHPIAMELLCVCVVAIGVITWRFAKGQTTAPSEAVVRAALVGALLVQFALLLAVTPTAQPLRSQLIFRGGIVLAGAIALGVGLAPKADRVVSPIIPAIYLLLGLWVLKAAPPPPVDLVVFQHDAGMALLHGHNPYAIDFPNLYSHPERYYDASVVAGGRLKFGYPYPPLGLLMSLPAVWLGDFRIAHLVEMTLAGILMMRARPGAVATLAATLFLFTPRSFFILEAGFTEPAVVLLLSLTLYAACRGWRVLPILFGLFLASKQYLILALPSGILLFDASSASRWKRSSILIAISLAIAALTMAPFWAWNPAAFFRSVVTLQFHQPIRSDALSILPRLIARTGWSWLIVIPFAAAIALIVVVVTRFPRTLVGFAIALATTFFIFFATNKQAFCGYYLLVLASLCWAIALPWLRESDVL